MTHESKTNPDARLIRKGKEAKLSYCLSALMENRNELLTGIDLELATGFAERDLQSRTASPVGRVTAPH